MAEIREQLTLSDNFSSTWDKYISQGEKASNTIDQLTANHTIFADTAEESLAHIDAALNRMVENEQASLNKQNELINSTNELNDATQHLETNLVSQKNWGYNIEAQKFIENAGQISNATQQISQDFDTVAMAEQLATTMAQERAAAEIESAAAAALLSEELIKTTQAYLEQSEAITAVEPSIERYEAQIKAVEKALTNQNSKLQQALIEYTAIVSEQGAASESANRQRDAITALNQTIDESINRHQELNSALEEFTNNNPSETVEQVDRASRNAANGGLDILLRKVNTIIAAFLSWRAIMGGIKNALAEERYEIRFNATFGMENGENVLQWVRNTANELGRATQEIADATTRFSRATTNPENLERLIKVADRFARFSISGDYDSIVNAIDNSLRTGNLRQLSTQTGISTQALEDFGVKDALKAGDVDAYVTALEKAGETIGLTDEAYQAALASSGAQFDKFVNTIQNKAQQAARGFLTAFSGTFEKLNEFFNSEPGATFFAALQSGFEFIATAASYVLDILIGVATFIGNNWSAIITGAALVVTYFGVQLLFMAAAALVANAPLILLIALFAGIAYALSELGLGAEELFEGLGALWGGFYNIVSNIIGNLWNAIAAFVEFFANVWSDPLGSVVRLFVEVFDTILGVVESVAGAIDFILGQSLSEGVKSFRSNIKGWLNQTYGEADLIIARWEQTDFATDVEKFAAAGKDLGNRLDNFDPESFLPGEGAGSLADTLGADHIGQDLLGAGGGAVPVKVKNDVNLADEDLKLLVDLAERRYVADVNVKTLSPNVNVNVTNNTKGDPLNPDDVADVVMWAIEEQINNHTDLVYV